MPSINQTEPMPVINTTWVEEAGSFATPHELNAEGLCLLIGSAVALHCYHKDQILEHRRGFVE